MHSTMNYIHILDNIIYLNIYYEKDKGIYKVPTDKYICGFK